MPTTLYVGTDVGVYKSTNGGGNWTAVNSLDCHPILVFHAIAIDPATPTELYAGTNAGILESEDSGGNWNR